MRDKIFNKVTIFPFIVIVLCMAAIVYATSVRDNKFQRRFLANNIERSDDQALVSAVMQAFEIDQVDANDIFIRYQSGNGTVFIKRITTTNDIITIQKANDFWTNRASAVFTPINN